VLRYVKSAFGEDEWILGNTQFPLTNAFYETVLGNKTSAQKYLPLFDLWFRGNYPYCRDRKNGEIIILVADK
jgi:hypothetical protein